MLKMFIDNEEVVSNKDFTIKEEMLNASSTILNNTYPKSWEQDKDYTSRFYYPKDYAKLNIQNHTLVQQAEAGTTIQVNEAATINDVNASKNSKVTKLLGQTSQTTIDGRNLLDGAHPTDYNVATTTFTNDIIKVSSTNTTTLPQARFQIDNLASNDVVRYSTIIQSSNGMVVGQAYSNGTWTSLGSMTSYYTNGTSPSTASWTNTSGYTKFRLTLYSSKTIPTGNSESSYKETIVTINNSDLTYVPYVGGVQSPNPNYPQPINVVSGDNEITICGKNFLDRNNATENVILVWATGLTSNNTNSLASDYIVVSPNEKIISTYRSQAMFYGKNKEYLGCLQTGGTTIAKGNGDYFSAFTIPNINEIKYVRLGFRSSINNNVDMTSVNIMVNKGTTLATYEPYQSQTYQVNLPVENLLNKELIVSGNTSNYEVTQLPTGVRLLHKNSYSTGVPILTLTLKPNTTYTFSQKANATSGNPGSGIKTTNGSYSYVTTGSKTITTESDGVIIILFGSSLGSGVSCDYTDIQLEEGTKQNSFTPYGTTPIELCKIGTYQDYIYKDNGSWYLHKEIAKIDLGSLTYTSEQQYSTGQFVSNASQWSKAPVYLGGLASSILIWQEGNVAYNTLQTGKMAMTNSQALPLFRIRDASFISYDADTIKTALNGNMLYYQMYVPTTTIITDETLISQLDALESS